MSKSFKAATAAAFSILSISFVVAYGATSAASAKSSSFETPVVADTSVASSVELTPSSAPQSASADASPSAGESASPIADSPAPTSLAELVAAYDDATVLDAEATCLATAVFFESRSESLAGQLAVAEVVVARANSGRFPDNLCAVITQEHQFSFVRNGRMPAVPTHRPAWRVAKAIAQIALDGSWHNPVEGALYFHSTYAAPNWGHEQVAQIGRHIFYR